MNLLSIILQQQLTLLPNIMLLIILTLLYLENKNNNGFYGTEDIVKNVNISRE